MTDNREKLFELLYNSSDVENMYKARCYVLEYEINKVFDKDFFLTKNKCFILSSDSDLMLAIARQLALVMHFSDYDELKDENGTTITICCQNVDATTNKLRQNKYLFNLMQYCQVYNDGILISDDMSKRNDKLPLDIRIDLLNGTIKDYGEGIKNSIIITEENVNNFIEDYKRDYFFIDVSKAKLVNAIYIVGSDIENLSINDNTNVQKYMTALSTFCFHLDKQEVGKAWEKASVNDKLSSVFCADCFTIRLYELFGKDALRKLSDDFENVVKKVADNIEVLASHEHTRWNVEKLVMGFMPYSSKQKFLYESLFKKERNAYKKKLKKNHNVHLDLCSTKELKRIDPGNVKYDVFLMLAMPKIVMLCNEYIVK